MEDNSNWVHGIDKRQVQVMASTCLIQYVKVPSAAGGLVGVGKCAENAADNGSHAQRCQT